MANNNKIITLSGLIMMIFTSIFGFGNTPVAFDQMGYASIFWYVLAALLFFLPASLMFAEYGASLKEAKGAFTPGWKLPLAKSWPLLGPLSGWCRRPLKSGSRSQLFFLGPTWGRQNPELALLWPGLNPVYWVTGGGLGGHHHLAMHPRNG